MWERPLIEQEFQSTLPLRGATSIPGSLIRLSSISIHAPLAGSDLLPRLIKIRRQFISIHAPLAGSDGGLGGGGNPRLISIHAPLAGSDLKIEEGHVALDISIHAPLAGSDERPPMDVAYHLPISIHAPLAGSDIATAMS